MGPRARDSWLTQDRAPYQESKGWWERLNGRTSAGPSSGRVKLPNKASFQEQQCHSTRPVRGSTGMLVNCFQLLNANTIRCTCSVLVLLWLGAAAQHGVMRGGKVPERRPQVR